MSSPSDTSEDDWDDLSDGAAPAVGAHVTNEEFACRLKAARARTGMTQPVLASRAGIPLPTYKNYEGGAALPNSKALSGLTAAGINANYLLVGADPILTLDPAPERTDSASYVKVPLLDVKLSAGEGQLIDEERAIGTRAFSREWLEQELRMDPKYLRLCVVFGDSMRPTLENGDLVMINTKETRVLRDDIYALREGDVVMVKRLQRMPIGGVKVISDNPAYPAMTFMNRQAEERDMAVVGRAVWWAHTNAR